MRAESLQWRPPRSFEPFIAARTIAGVAKKFLDDAPCDDPRAPLSDREVHARLVAAVLDDERSVAAAYRDRSQSAASAAGFSIATTASPSAGILHCSSAPSDASVEISLRIPSTNTLGFAAVVIAACGVALRGGVAFSGELTDLDWGSWEGSLPESSSLGGDGIPLRGAFIRFRPGFKNSLRGKLYQLCGAGDIFIAINSWRLGPFWSAEMAHSFAATDRLRANAKITAQNVGLSVMAQCTSLLAVAYRLLLIS